MGTKEELAEMFDALEKVSVKTDAPTTDPPTEVKTDPPSTDPPSEVKTDPPSTDPPVEDELTKAKRENEELRQKLAEAESKKAPKTEAPTTDAPISDLDLLKELDIDLDDLTADPTKLNKLLNEVYKRAILASREEFNRIKTRIPGEVVKDIEHRRELADLNKKFYEQNKDLMPFGKVVATVFEEVASQNPSMKIAEVLGKVGDETRKRLNLPKPKVEDNPKPDDKDKPPPLPRKKGSKVIPPKPEPNSLRSEIDSMNKTLGR